MIRRLALAAALLSTGAPSARAQIAVQLRDAGPGAGVDLLARAVASPHTVLPPVSGQRIIRADSSYSRTVIALGSTVIVEGTVHGDLLVVGGDLFMHPGGRIDGRAIAIGGGVYESTLAHTDSVFSFRDFTYEIEPVAGGFALKYHAFSISADTTATLSLPGIKGFGIPTYDRIDGLSLGFGPLFRVPKSSIRIEPRVTYRSHLGTLDPSVSAGTLLDRRTSLRLNAGRGTYSNDAWIWSDLVNSGEFLLVGDDTRNYYRATRADLSVARMFESVASTFEPYVGGRLERGTSVPRDTAATSAPWTLLNRRDADDARRPNPRVDEGTIASAVAGARYDWTATGGIVGAAKIDAEVGSYGARSTSGVGCAVPAACGASSFGQLTVDGNIVFPTFGLQTLRFDIHVIATAARRTPRQRYGYIGGPGTISTLELFEQGGDQLVFLDWRYSVPFSRVTLPLIGSPTVTVREVLAGAAVKRFPALEQGTGARIAAGFVYFEFLLDPVHGRLTRGFGVSIAR